MNSHDFTYLLQNPQDITPLKTEGLNSIVNQFPYFQAAKALHLKGLKLQESTTYNEALKTTAAYTTDRSILFDYITSEEFLQDKISKIIKQNSIYLNDIDVDSETVPAQKSVAIDDELKQQIKDSSDVLDPELFQPKHPIPKKTVNFSLDENDKIEDATNETKTQEVTAEDILKLGKPLQFDKRETHSFNEWLKLTRFKPIKRNSENINTPEESSTKEATKTSDKAKKIELIDNFIAKNPKIVPNKTTKNKKNLAKDTMIQPEALMTETLARIYVEQKNYKKAIQSYKILSLKYPEKSSFFANQIKAIEQLQEQNKDL